VSAAAGRLDLSYLLLPTVVEVLLLVVGLVALAAVRSDRLRDRMLRMLAGLFRRLRLNAPVAAWGEAIETLAGNLREPSRLLGVLGWSAMVWVCDAGALWLMLAAFGHPLDPGALLVGYGLVNLISALPELTPGWLGVLETSLSVTYAAFGVPTGVAVVAVLSYRLLSYWLPTAVGVPAALTLLRPRLGERQAA
jgi:uncharacterized protein (TIRG00374 family)